ncbi:helix-turn-helix domain-containing protein [Streptomyces antimycoticus]|uniref:helix-turn-helix domain-containing protein n=1 Tax=Streptomyces antimycoticus TaxID=68175 RepID=UPI003F4D8C63
MRGSQRYCQHAQLLRRFREDTGTSVLAWINRERVDRAKVLLETTDHGTTDKAAMVGFGSAETLRRNFRKNVGVTTVNYRAQYRAENTGAARTPCRDDGETGGPLRYQLTPGLPGLRPAGQQEQHGSRPAGRNVRPYRAGVDEQAGDVTCEPRRQVGDGGDRSGTRSQATLPTKSVPWARKGTPSGTWRWRHRCV